MNSKILRFQVFLNGLQYYIHLCYMLLHLMYDSFINVVIYSSFAHSFIVYACSAVFLNINVNFD